MTKVHTSKLTSLPDNLRKVADELLATKFKEPEVVEKRVTERVESIRFPRRPSMLAYNSDDEFGPSATYEPDPTENCIESRSLEMLRSYAERMAHANSNERYGTYGGYIVCKMALKFYPIGDFRMYHSGDNWMARQYMQQSLNNLTLDMDIVPGQDSEQLESRIMDYMDRLRVRFGGGAFEAVITDTRLDRIGGYGY